jgi:hypothetical protein
MEEANDVQVVRQLQFQMSLKLLEALKIQLQYFQKVTDLEFKREIAVIDSIPAFRVETSTAEFPFTVRSDMLPVKLESINEKVTAYYKSAVMSRNSLEEVGKEIRFFSRLVSDLGSNMVVIDTIEAGGTERESMITLPNVATKEQVNKPHSEERTYSGQSKETNAYRAGTASSEMNIKTRVVERTLRKDFDECWRSSPPVKRSHSEEGMKTVNPYSPDSENKRKRRKEGPGILSPSKSPVEECRKEIMNVKKGRVDFSGVEGQTRNRPQGMSVIEKETFNKVGNTRKATNMRLPDQEYQYLSTQPEEGWNRKRPDDEYMTDSDTEYLKLTDVERTSSAEKEGKDDSKKDGPSSSYV